MSNWLDYLNTYPLVRYIGMPVLILAGFWVFQVILCRSIVPGIIKLRARRGVDTDGDLVMAILKPIRVLIWLLGLYVALIYLPLADQSSILFSRFFRSLLIIILAWGMCVVVNANSSLTSGLQQKYKLDSVLVVFFSRVLKFVLAALALVLLANEWGYDINGFIAGLGLGGLAFALAAKDALANIFGGIVIIMEKPFAIGDWVQTPSVEGVVEDISFRSTRFRTFPQALVTMPNSTLANEPITNWSKMGKRQITFSLAVDYAGPRDRIENCVASIKAMLSSHEEVHPQTILVNLDAINATGLEIFVYFFTNTTNWVHYCEVKQDINFRVLDILAAADLSLATPGRQVYSERPDLMYSIPVK
ncbi:MAG: mechanosensitive ion channel family protein [Syntrophomonadaceae bacterium]|nr:mechanosensitive ion channel family protein [Syntrophomonadaceae bacterium]